MKSSIILSTLFAALFLVSCDQPIFQSNKTSELGEAYYQKLGVPPEMVDRLSPEQFMELIQYLNRREERLQVNPEAAEAIRLYEDIGLPREIAERMEGHQILEYVQLSEEWQRIGNRGRSMDLYNNFGLNLSLLFLFYELS